MQVVSCCVRDEIQIGDSARIVILDIAGDHVRIGVTTPGAVPEYHEEVLYVAGASEAGTGEAASSEGRLVRI